jgi:hypothetical protein
LGSASPLPKFFVYFTSRTQTPRQGSSGGGNQVGAADDVWFGRIIVRGVGVAGLEEIMGRLKFAAAVMRQAFREAGRGGMFLHLHGLGIAIL